jgi:hypothetical protein
MLSSYRENLSFFAAGAQTWEAIIRLSNAASHGRWPHGGRDDDTKTWRKFCFKGQRATVVSIRLLLQIATDVLERLAVAMLVCVMSAIISGVDVSVYLLVVLIGFVVIGAFNAIRGYAAERTGKSTPRLYSDALTNLIVGFGIYGACRLMGKIL